MGKQYGYYGVILDVLDKILGGDYMVRVMCEDGSVNRICAPINQFRLEDLKRGTVIIYTKSYYWNLVYLNTDIEKYKYSKGDLLKKAFINGIKWTPEEIKIIEDDSFTRRTMNYLFDMPQEDRELWFDKFVDRNTPDAIAKTCDENGEMLWEYYALEVDPRKFNNNLLYLRYRGNISLTKKEVNDMATYNKTQFKKRAEELKEKLSSLRLEFEDLQSDLESESSDIEPYENRDDLTELQEQRQEWLDNTASTIEETVNSLQEAEDNLDNIEE